LIKDSVNNIWISSYDGSLCYYNGREIVIPPIQNKLKEINNNTWIHDLVQRNDSIYYAYAKSNFIRKNRLKNSLNKPLLEININSWNIKQIWETADLFKNNFLNGIKGSIVNDKFCDVLLPAHQIRNNQYYIIPQKTNFSIRKLYNNKIKSKDVPSLIKINGVDQKIKFSTPQRLNKIKVINNQLWVCTSNSLLRMDCFMCLTLKFISKS